MRSGAENDGSPAARLYAAAARPARLVRAICQMILGAGIAVALILKVYMLVLTDHQCVVDGSTLGNAIRCTPVLMIMAYGMALVAGFDLACRLFSDSLQSAVTPLIFGVSAALLMMVSELVSESGRWQSALVVLAMSVLFGALFFVRERFLQAPGKDDPRP